MKKPKVLLIGWDAADWKIIWPLLQKGEMPALKGLMERGVYGNMSTMNPAYSPMLWSTVATGKTPDKHGVLGFVEVKEDASGVQPVTSNSRKSKALWNILHNQGLKSNVIGWWPSFPVEPINGVMVSNKFQKVSNDPKKRMPLGDDVVHPESIKKEIAKNRMYPWEITESHVLPFIPRATEINQDKDKKLQSFARIMAENVSIHCATTYLLRNIESDFTAVYYDLIDHMCHAFMRYHPPRLKQVSEAQYEIYKDVIVSAYRFQDMMLERKLELVDDNTTVILISDHGYQSGDRRIIKMPKYPAAPSLEHRQFGIFVAAGPNIKKNQKVFGLGLIDIAPTILNIYGLPIGKDMDGKVAMDIFEKPQEPAYIESWEVVKGDFGQNNNTSESSLSDEQMMQQLIDLGYIEEQDQKVENAILKTKCDLKHNLARVKLGLKSYKEAKSILLELVSADYPIYKEEDVKRDEQGKILNPNIEIGEPIIDTIPYYMDLLMITLEQKSFDEAKEFLKEIKKRDKHSLVNTTYAQSKVLFNDGKTKEALSILEDQKDKKPSSEVWFQIGLIYRSLSKFGKAKEAFKSSLDYEVDRAKTHKCLAEVQLRLNEYEEAADHALVAIELIKYYPEAHYILGEALEKMGDLQNAKKAYSVAASLKPKSYSRVNIALENVNEKIRSKSNGEGQKSFKYRENQIVIVSGLPRSGTSLMMQMLNAAGVDILTDNLREADESNPKGYYEYKPVMSIHKDNSWLELSKNKAVKIVAPLLKYVKPELRYKVIFMNRDLNEVVKSQQKMIGKDPNTLPTKLMSTYQKLLKHVNTWKDKEPGVELLYLDYKETISDTASAADKVEQFLGIKLQKDKMIACVDKKLYRNRV